MAKKIDLSYHHIEQSLRIFRDTLVAPTEVGYDLLLAFGKSEADIRRYKDGKGVLKSPYDLLHLSVGYNKNRENIMVEVKDITYHEGVVEYHLGQVLEHKQA